MKFVSFGFGGEAKIGRKGRHIVVSAAKSQKRTINLEAEYREKEIRFIVSL
jgi:hypothetical protein